MVKKAIDTNQTLFYNGNMNRQIIAKLAYQYLDASVNPDWSGLSDALIKHGCNLYEVQDILMSIKDGEY